MGRVIMAVFALAILLRVLVMATYTPVVLTYYGGDSTRYLRLPFTGFHGLFSDPNIPAGYPAFLDVARWLSHSIYFTIGLQHAIGVGTGVLLLLLVRKTGAPLWVGLLPACVVLFSGDHIFLETALLTETLWMFMFVAGLCAAMTARGSRNARWWLLAAGALLAVAAIVRHLSLPFIVVIAIWALFEFSESWRARLTAAVAILASAAVILLAYLGTVSLVGGYAGFTDMSGFNLYARVGQFANCHDFTPPSGTAGLCEYTPSSSRNGPYYYSYDPASPLYKAGFGADPRSAPLLGKFARAAILHEPLSYIQAVAKDLLRYVAPYAEVVRPGSGADPERMSFFNDIPTSQGQAPQELADEFSEDYYGIGSATTGQWTRELLGSYQEIFRVGGLLTVVFGLLSIVGVFFAQGAVRRVILLFGLLALYLYVAPVALSSYDARYGVPAAMMLSVSAALGGWAIGRRIVGANR